MSGGPPQVLEQGLDRRCFRLHDPELAHEGAKIVEHFFSPHATRLADVLLDQIPQMLQVRLHALGRYAMDVDELVVVAIHEATIEVEHVRKPASEAGSEIESGAAEYTNHAA